MDLQKLHKVQDSVFIKDSSKKLGDCYRQAYRFFDKNIDDNPDLKLVHGLVIGQGPLEGVKYDHAWCEDDDFCYDETLPPSYKQLPIAIYYHLARASNEDSIYYTKDEVYKEILENSNYGPWDKERLKFEVIKNGIN